MIVPEPKLEVCSFRRHQYLARAGEAQQQIYRLEEGWACRFRVLRDGRRQIVALFLPGELCEPQWILSHRADLPVVALTPLRATTIGMDTADGPQQYRRDLLEPVYDAMLQSLNRQAEWIVSLGRKTAAERICALIRDIFLRLRGNGRLIGDRFAMPLTQYDIADIVGLTPVHVNRVFKSLRRDGVIELKSRSMRIADLAAMQQLAAE